MNFVSSRNGAHGTLNKCNVSRSGIINNENGRKLFDSYISMTFSQDADETCPRSVSVCVMKFCKIILWRLPNERIVFKQNTANVKASL